MILDFSTSPVHWDVSVEPSASSGEQPTLTTSADATVQQPKVIPNALHSLQTLLFSLVNISRRNKMQLHFVRPSDISVNDLEPKTSWRVRVSALLLDAFYFCNTRIPLPGS